jgi:hypothetical protein
MMNALTDFNFSKFSKKKKKKMIMEKLENEGKFLLPVAGAIAANLNANSLYKHAAKKPQEGCEKGEREEDPRDLGESPLSRLETPANPPPRKLR